MVSRRQVKQAMAKAGKSSAELANEREKSMAEARLLQKKELEMRKFEAEKVSLMHALRTSVQCANDMYNVIQATSLMALLYACAFENTSSDTHARKNSSLRVVQLTHAHRHASTHTHNTDTQHRHSLPCSMCTSTSRSVQNKYGHILILNILVFHLAQHVDEK